MTFNDMVEAVAEAERVRRLADRQACAMANLIAGRLQQTGVSHRALCKLKRELANYDMRTGLWR